MKLGQPTGRLLVIDPSVALEAPAAPPAERRTAPTTDERRTVSVSDAPPREATTR